VFNVVFAARRTKTMDFEWTAETCYWLLRNGGVDEEIREKVARIVEGVVGEFRRSVGRWRDETPAGSVNTPFSLLAAIQLVFASTPPFLLSVYSVNCKEFHQSAYIRVWMWGYGV